MNLYLGCSGDSFQGLRLCKGIGNAICEIETLDKETHQWLLTKLPKRKLQGDREILLILTELNARMRGIISLTLCQGFIAFHRTHEEHGNHIYLEIK